MQFALVVAGPGGHWFLRQDVDFQLGPASPVTQEFSTAKRAYFVSRGAGLSGYVAERVLTVFKHGRPKKVWAKVRGMRNEALDCLVMALGARQLCAVDLTHRENVLRGVASTPAPTVFRSKWMQGIRE